MTDATTLEDTADDSANARPLVEAPRTVPGLTPALRRRLQRIFGAVSRFSPRLAGRLALTLFLTPPRRVVEDVDVPVLARARRLRIPVGAAHVQGYVWGPDDGPLVLLLHGWGSHAARFGGFVDPLVQAGFRVLGFDAPAHGESPGRRSDMAKFREALERVHADIGPIESVVAHSLGAAATVWWVAERSPESVKSIALVGMPPDTAYMMDSFSALLGLGRDVRTHLASYFAQRLGESHERFSTRELAHRVGIPTLVVHDREDDVAPFSHAELFTAALPRGAMLATAGLNHSGSLRDAATIQSIVEFVRSSRAQRTPDPSSSD